MEINKNNPLLKKLYIGTSGWSYNSWKEFFYPEKLPKNKWLNYYSNFFNTVEINSSFYHLPRSNTFKNWASQTPESFLFSVKVSRYITHIKKLVDCREPFLKLLESSTLLGEKLKIFLFQFPSTQKKDLAKIEDFLNLTKKLTLRNLSLNFVFEFRHESWFCNETYRLLDVNGAGIVISSSPSFPFYKIITGKLCYIRMHGSKELYSSCYSDEELKNLSFYINSIIKDSDYVFIYFNNDYNCYAVKNAQTLLNFCYSNLINSYM